MRLRIVAGLVVTACTLILFWAWSHTQEYQKIFHQDEYWENRIERHRQHVEMFETLIADAKTDLAFTFAPNAERVKTDRAMAKLGPEAYALWLESAQKSDKAERETLVRLIEELEVALAREREDMQNAEAELASVVAESQK